MDLNNKLKELQMDNAKLREENLQMYQQVLEFRMEHSINDRSCSESLAGNMNQFFPKPISPWFMMLVFYPEGQGTDHVLYDERAGLMLSIRDNYAEALSEFGQTFFFPCSGFGGCLVNILGYDCSTEEARDNVAKRIQSKLASQRVKADGKAGKSVICMSSISGMDDGPRRLYREVKSISMLRTEESPQVCVAMDVAEKDSTSPRSLFQLELQFWQYALTREFAKCAETMDQILNAEQKHQKDINLAKAVVFTKLELLLENLHQETKADPQTDRIIKDMLSKVNHTVNYQELIGVIYDVLKTIDDRYSSAVQSGNRKIAEIERYIMEHYGDRDLSASVISAKFMISPSHLSRTFREDMGVCMVDFIHRVRIGKAKELMADTNLSLNKIAEQTGFSNHWDLIRTFKKTEGTTPGAYRSTLPAYRRN